MPDSRFVQPRLPIALEGREELRRQRPTVARLIEEADWSRAPVAPRGPPAAGPLAEHVTRLDVRVATRDEALPEVRGSLLRSLSVDVPPEVVHDLIRTTLGRVVGEASVMRSRSGDPRALVRDFESSVGLGVDGVLGRDDLLALLASLPDDGVPDELRPMFDAALSEWNDEIPDVTDGSMGPHILLLQARLDDLGLPTGAVEGTADATTIKSVRRYQAAAELQATGVVDDPTWDALLNGLPPVGAGTSPRYLHALHVVLESVGLGPFEHASWTDATADAVTRFREAAGLPPGAEFDAAAWIRALSNDPSFFADALGEVGP